MTKKLLGISLLFICSSLYSQVSKDLIVNKMKNLIHQYVVDISSGVRSGKNPAIYFNKVEKILDIDGYQIPLQDVKTTYLVSQQCANCVQFYCKQDDCIIYPRGAISIGFAISFLSKQICYDFIELINQLKE